MNQDFMILRQLIRDEALVTVKEDRNNKTYLELKEPQSGKSPEYQIKLIGLPGDTIAIKSDKFPPPNNIFCCSKGECKRADFVIIARGPIENWIVYLEMKLSNHGQNSKIIQQLQGSTCFIDYCRTIGQMFWKDPHFLLKNDYEQRYVSVKNIFGNKLPSRVIQTELHDSPKTMLRISAPDERGIQFNKLIGERS